MDKVQALAPFEYVSPEALQFTNEYPVAESRFIIDRIGRFLNRKVQLSLMQTRKCIAANVPFNGFF